MSPSLRWAIGKGNIVDIYGVVTLEPATPEQADEKLSRLVLGTALEALSDFQAAPSGGNARDRRKARRADERLTAYFCEMRDALESSRQSKLEHQRSVLEASLNEHMRQNLPAELRDQAPTFHIAG